MKKKFENFSYPVSDHTWDALAAHIPARGRTGFLGAKFKAYTVAPSVGVWKGIDAALRQKSDRRPAAWWWVAAAGAFFLLGYLASLDQVGFKKSHHLSENAPAQVEAENSDKAATENLDETPTQKESRDQANSAEPTNISDSSTYPAEHDNPKPVDKPILEDDRQVASKMDAQNNSSVKIAAEKTDTSLPVRTKSPAVQNGKNLWQPPRLDQKPQSAGEAILNQTHGFADRKLGNETTENKAKNYPELPMKIIPPAVTRLVGGELFAEEPREIIPIDPIALDGRKSSPFYDGNEPSPAHDFSILAGSQLAFALGNTDGEDAALLFGSGSGMNDGTGSISDLVASSPSTSYAPPIYYGLHGELQVWKHFSAGLGLGYLRTARSTSILYGAQNQTIESINSYLSLPVYLKFNYVDKPKFAAYTSFGSAYEVLVNQKTTAETVQNGVSVKDEIDPVGQSGDQANIYSALGMNIKITKHIGVFAEASAMHYFYLTSDNFYGRQKIWPGMRFGAVVSF